MSALQDEIREAISPVAAEMAALRAAVKALRDHPDALLTCRQAAERLGLSESAFRRKLAAWLAEGMRIIAPQPRPKRGRACSAPRPARSRRRRRSTRPPRADDDRPERAEKGGGR